MRMRRPYRRLVRPRTRMDPSRGELSSDESWWVGIPVLHVATIFVVVDDDDLGHEDADGGGDDDDDDDDASVAARLPQAAETPVFSRQYSRAGQTRRSVGADFAVLMARRVHQSLCKNGSGER